MGNDSIREIDIIPDPQILVVLTYASMKPIDSLCELIDNAIDSFRLPERIEHPLVLIDLPTRREISEGTALLRVRDNGPGLSLDEVEQSLRAGYSTKFRYGTLGLFGVGFNIASGKLGQVTKFITARRSDEYAIETTLDLPKLRRQRDYKLFPKKIEKPNNFECGTIVEVSNPWPEGNQNFGFMLKLVGAGRPTIHKMLGRRYATILRDKEIRIQVGEDTVEQYEHCAWGEGRYVERRKHGKIYAKYNFDEVIFSQKRCAECGELILESENKCAQPECGSRSLRTMEERIYGWIGIQRYLDPSHYGIDLIRNGRAIRTLEKSAFFEFINEEGEPIFDYPIDDRAGRIIGEVHIDHVPVDPAKQDYERSSPEWRRAVTFLRGESSLQPTQPGADQNNSYIYKLYQGYRKVRNPGTHDMYMGKWQPGSAKSVLLTQSEIVELKKKFDERETGYFDDKEWWKYVEEADRKPLEGLKKCPECHADCVEDSEECPGCGYIFEGKECINSECNRRLKRTAIVCSFCGYNQIPEVHNPWNCEVCGHSNTEEAECCDICGNPRGTVDPLSKEALLGQSYREEELSFEGLTVMLSSGESSNPFNLKTYICKDPIVSTNSEGIKTRLPAIRFIESGIELFVDPSHQIYVSSKVTLEQVASYETAQYLFALNQGLASKYPREHSITKIAGDILAKYWGVKEEREAEETEYRLREIFNSIKSRLAAVAGDSSQDIYDLLNEREIESLVIDMVNSKRDPAQLKDMVRSGEYIIYLSPKAILKILREYPSLFFDGNIWQIGYENIDTEASAKKRIQKEIRERYHNCLESLAIYMDSKNHSTRKFYCIT